MSTSATGTSADPADSPHRRIPQAAFIVGFGALLLVCIVLTVGLFNYESGAQERIESSAATATGTSSTSTTPPVTRVTGSDGSVTISREPKPAPPETSLDNVNASIRSYLIADAKTARTYTGIAVTGTLTDFAMTDLPELTGHISRLLQQNCVDSMALEAPGNQRVTFTGFCFTTLPPETIQRMLSFALEHKADSIDLSNYPGHGNQNKVAMTWFVETQDEAEKIHESWHSLRRPRAIEQISLFTYTPEEAHRVQKTRGYPDRATTDPIIEGGYARAEDDAAAE